MFHFIFKYLTVGNGLFGQIIIDDQSMFAVVTEEFSHSTARIWSQVLQRSSIGSRGGDDDGVADGTGICQPLYDLSDSGSLLSDGDVDAVKLLLFVGSIVEPLLVNNGVDGQGSLASLSVTDDQLTLTTTDGYERIYSFDSCNFEFI